jgi:hypothetical protein
MNAVFTIVAKNYLAHANTLGDSLKATNPDLAYHVILADEADGALDLSAQRYATMEARSIGIDGYLDMAFKYDLVEFATAIKPFVFEYLFDQHGYERIIYLDPDILVYSSASPILDALDENFMVLTPHLTKLSHSGKGAISEETILFVGTYNLGFVAFRNDEPGRSVLAWWRERLRGKAYADRMDALHVDQKWMDLVPAFFDEGVCVSRHPGLNVSHWNMHERELSVGPEGYRLDHRPLVFFHFSGFDPRHPDAITGSHKQSVLTLEQKPEYRELFADYAAKLLANRSDAAGASYSYGKFADGVRIYSFQRRLYRKLSENGYQFADPFATTAGSFHDLLRKNRLLISGEGASAEFSQRNIANAPRKLRALKRGLLMLKKVMGIRYYHLLMRTMAVLARPEEQAFLLETIDLDVPPRFGMIPGSPASSERMTR